MIWPLILAPLAGIYGFSRGYLALRNGRRPLKGKEALLSWEEAPRSILWQDSLVGLIILLHSFSLLLLAVVGLRACLAAWETPLPEQIQGGSWLYYGALTLTVIHIWMSAGAALSFPILSSRIGPIPIHLQLDGVLHGRVRIPWSKIGWVERVPASRGLLLRSRRNRHIILINLMPPTDELLEQAETLIRTRLNRPNAAGVVPIKERKVTFVILMLATVLPFLLIGLAVSPWRWSFLYFSFAMFLATTLGSRVLVYYFS